MTNEEKLTEIEENGIDLTEWEEDFTSDLRERFDKDEDFELSPAQERTLDKIYDDRVA